MAVNSDKPALWKQDIARSVDLYNGWFLAFAPEAFRSTRIETTGQVEVAFAHTANLTLVNPDVLGAHPEILHILRMCTCPPIARDRLVGLSGTPPQVVKSIELKGHLPKRMGRATVRAALEAVCKTIVAMLDPDIVVWKDRRGPPGAGDVHRAATVIADRVCGAVTDPIIRNAQERRQLAAIAAWLRQRGYRHLEAGDVQDIRNMPEGSFAFRVNVPVGLADGKGKQVNIPVDVAIRPPRSPADVLPIMIEAKSAGDFTNVNKRRKEEAAKMAQLRANYGHAISYVLFLCGYFDSGYLGYEAAEGIDWVWEHRIDDLAEFGL